MGPCLAAGRVLDGPIQGGAQRQQPLHRRLQLAHREGQEGRVTRVGVCLPARPCREPFAPARSLKTHAGHARAAMHACACPCAVSERFLTCAVCGPCYQAQQGPHTRIHRCLGRRMTNLPAMQVVLKRGRQPVLMQCRMYMRTYGPYLEGFGWRPGGPSGQPALVMQQALQPCTASSACNALLVSSCS